MKINRYMHDHGISHETLAKVAAKNFRNGAGNEKAWRRTPMTEEEILAAPVLNYPLTPVHVLRPDEGAARRRPVPRRPGPQVHVHARYGVRATALRSRRLRRVRGVEPVAAGRGAGAPARPWTPPGRRTRRRGSAPTTSTSPSCRTPTPDPRSSTWPRTASAPTASRNADRRGRHRDRRKAPGQHRRRAARQRRAHRRLRTAPDPRDRAPAARHAPAPGRSPARPASATPTSTARPACRR